MTKALHRRINCVLTWDSVLTLDSDSIKELQFWLRSVKNLNCHLIVLKPSLCRKVVYSDASNTVAQHSFPLTVLQFFIRTGMPLR